MPDMRAYPRYPISNMKNPYPIRPRYLIFRTFCSTIEFESPEQTISRFRSGLRNNYHRTLIARGVTTLEQAYRLVTDLDEFREFFLHRTNFRDSSKTTTTSKHSYNSSFPAQSKPTSSTSGVKPMGPSNTKLTIFERKTASEQAKTNPSTQCYKYHGYGYFTIQCPSQTKTLLVEVPIEDVDKVWKWCAPTGRRFKHFCLTSDCDRAHLGVVRCTSTQPE